MPRKPKDVKYTEPIPVEQSVIENIVIPDDVKELIEQAEQIEIAIIPQDSTDPVELGVNDTILIKFIKEEDCSDNPEEYPRFNTETEFNDGIIVYEFNPWPDETELEVTEDFKLLKEFYDSAPKNAKPIKKKKRSLKFRWELFKARRKFGPLYTEYPNFPNAKQYESIDKDDPDWVFKFKINLIYKIREIRKLRNSRGMYTKSKLVPIIINRELSWDEPPAGFIAPTYQTLYDHLPFKMKVVKVVINSKIFRYFENKIWNKYSQEKDDLVNTYLKSNMNWSISGEHCGVAFELPNEPVKPLKRKINKSGKPYRIHRV